VTVWQIATVAYVLIALIVMILLWIIFDLMITDEEPESRADRNLLETAVRSVPGGLPTCIAMLGLVWPYVVYQVLLDKPWRQHRK